MVNPEHLEILRQGVGAWNKWREKNPLGAYLRGADLRGADLNGAYLYFVTLSGANLINAKLDFAILEDASLDGANLQGASLQSADLSEADLSGADLRGANLSDANLRNADLSSADLRGVNLTRANLYGADLSYANLDGAGADNTVFADINFRKVKGLETVRHVGPSDISISSIYLSEGKIPELFLRGCGLPDDFIRQIPTLIAAVQPIQFYSCFISYSTKDEDFARRLYSRMRDADLRVWYAPEEAKGGERLYDQIDRAIQLHDRLLLVLSEDSIKSSWVTTEIRRARKAELKEQRRKLFPIRLVDFETIREWECFDADTGKDLAVELREFYIPDFSNWKDHDAFEVAFERLLRDLKAVA